MEKEESLEKNTKKDQTEIEETKSEKNEDIKDVPFTSEVYVGTEGKINEEDVAQTAVKSESQGKTKQHNIRSPVT